MDRQTRTGVTALIKSREMTGRSQSLHAVLWVGGRGKDDRKQNILVPLLYLLNRVMKGRGRVMRTDNIHI